MGEDPATMLTAKRTLVKSGPELWAEVSDPEALGSLLEPFGEIRITRVTDASLVIWEGERAAGRLELEPSGFGTRVNLSAEVAATPPDSEETSSRDAGRLRGYIGLGVGGAVFTAGAITGTCSSSHR